MTEPQQLLHQAQDRIQKFITLAGLKSEISGNWESISPRHSPEARVDRMQKDIEVTADAATRVKFGTQEFLATLNPAQKAAYDASRSKEDIESMRTAIDTFVSTLDDSQKEAWKQLNKWRQQAIVGKKLLIMKADEDDLPSLTLPIQGDPSDTRLVARQHALAHLMTYASDMLDLERNPHAGKNVDDGFSYKFEYDESTRRLQLVIYSGLTDLEQIKAHLQEPALQQSLSDPAHWQKGRDAKGTYYSIDSKAYLMGGFNPDIAFETAGILAGLDPVDGFTKQPDAELIKGNNNNGRFRIILRGDTATRIIADEMGVDIHKIKGAGQHLG